MSNNWANHALTIICSIALAPAASAQANANACTNSATAGTYSVACGGWTAGPGGSLVPIKQVGVAIADVNGFWTGATTINIAGQSILPKPSVSGQATLYPDCTGTITFNKGTASELNINFVANPTTKDIL